MKICWDNLEKLRYSQEKKLWYTKSYMPYEYREECLYCKEPYLTNKYKESISCSRSCSSIYNNPSKTEIARKKISKYHKGRKLSKKHKEKISKTLKGKYMGNNHPMYGKNHTKTTKEKIGKGGYHSKNIPLYDTYAEQIMYAEPVRRNREDKNILEVKCAYCSKWYIPKLTDLTGRISALNGYLTNGTELRLYCSPECKQECPIYRKRKYSAEETNTKQLSREVQPELRQLVFKRDNWTCQKCKSNKSLHCHHVEGIRWEPLESADIDKCITYCKDCHKEVHQKEECKTSDMRCKEI